MNGQFKSGQRGISFLGLLFVGGVLAVLVLLGLQILPTFIEYLAIDKAVNRAKDEGTVAAVRRSFDATASIDQISSITGNDLDITKEGEKVVVSYSYSREIPLVGPAFLVMKYAGRSK
jgi:hypothetical protein